MPLRFLTAGESHGKALVAILEGMPAGLQISADIINKQLARRQKGYGSSERMQIEDDKVEILSGVRNGETMGSPIALKINNKDKKRWDESISNPRPGHADLAGGLKYNFEDLRNVLERSSARETAIRVALGAVARELLNKFEVIIKSEVLNIGGESKNVKARVDAAKKAGDTLGGLFEVRVQGLPAGLGSYTHWDKRLDGKLAQALMSLQGIKGVEIGLGFKNADTKGSEAHDAIYYKDKYFRKTNHAGGIEGGMSNGEDLVLRAAMKPLSTLASPLASVDIHTKKEAKATVQRSDITAVPRAAVAAENIIALALADAFLEKFAGDSMKEVARNFKGYMKQVGEY